MDRDLMIKDLVRKAVEDVSDAVKRTAFLAVDADMGREIYQRAHETVFRSYLTGRLASHTLDNVGVFTLLSNMGMEAVNNAPEVRVTFDKIVKSLGREEKD